MPLRAICFVDMPFGQKPDLTSGVTVDFDQIYEAGIKPAIVDAGLEPVRGDQERTGGIIHVPMFGRLLLSDFVVADLTLSNPNVFYELGIRHTARPYTTVPIFAAIHPIPFDVALVFVAGRRALAREFARVAAKLPDEGSIWIGWPKQSSGVATDLTEDVVRDIGLATGVVDVKVCAIDATWSGLKFVRRLRDRTARAKA